MGDLYMGCSMLTALSFIKAMRVAGEAPLWLFFLSGIPILLILLNLILVFMEGYNHFRRLEVLCRDTLFINLSIGMILTIQQAQIQIH